MANQSSTERQHDTGPLPDLPLPVAPTAVATAPPAARPWLRPALIALAVLVLISAAALAIRLFNNPAADTRPVEVVQGFAAALEQRDVSTMLSYVEPTAYRREFGPELRAYTAYLEQITFRDATYELVSNDGQTAQVRWRATADYTVRERGSAQRPVDTTFELVKVEGAWYIRSVALPE